MSEPEIVDLGVLRGARIALSASESSDLARLGLTELHCRLVIAEVGRAVMLAGGVVVYGGDLRDDGYTEILVDQAQRFSRGRLALELVLPECVYGVAELARLDDLNRDLGQSGRMTLVSSTGELISRGEVASGFSGDVASSLSAMRAHISSGSAARVIVGGRLEGFAGAEPGIVEEARLTVEAGHPLLVAAGFGGASAALALATVPDLMVGWLPPTGFPNGKEGASAALGRFAAAYAATGVPLPNSTKDMAKTLTTSHRPADLAASVVGILAMMLSATG